MPRGGFIFEQGGKMWLEFHVDILGGTSNEKHDALRERLGPEGGAYSMRYEDAASAPCEYWHAPDVCRCSKQSYQTREFSERTRARGKSG